MSTPEKVIAFDSKEYNRPKIIDLPDEKILGKNAKVDIGFHSHLGVGILIKHPDVFSKALADIFSDQTKKFNLPLTRRFYSSNDLYSQIGNPRKAIAFCIKTAEQLQEYIELIHFSYIILSRKEFETVPVGGFGCPEIRIPRNDFIRQLGPMFSYITAWSFFMKRPKIDAEFHLDTFHSRHAVAWDELTTITHPKIYPRGDECNPFIAGADLFARATDLKLRSKKIKLKPENLEKTWENAKFEVMVRFVDKNVFSKIKWDSNDHIDTAPYLARPMVFILKDVPEQYKAKVNEKGKIISRPPKFKEVIHSSIPFSITVRYAQDLGGGIQFFDENIDSNKIKDGDKLIYIGREAQKLAETYATMWNVEVKSVLELREEYRKKGIES